MVSLGWIWLIRIVSLEGRSDFLSKSIKLLCVSPVDSRVIFVHLDVPLLELQHAVKLL